MTTRRAVLKGAGAAVIAAVAIPALPESATPTHIGPGFPLPLDRRGNFYLLDGISARESLVDLDILLGTLCEPNNSHPIMEGRNFGDQVSFPVYLPLSPFSPEVFAGPSLERWILLDGNTWHQHEPKFMPKWNRHLARR